MSRITPEKALSIKNDIMALAEKHGLWVTVEEERKPELKTVVVQVSIKVSEGQKRRP